MNKFILKIIIVLCFTLFQKANSQSDFRFYYGFGLEDDVKYSLALDFNFNFLKETSRFNFGSNLGINYTRFEVPLLATNSQSFFSVRFTSPI